MSDETLIPPVEAGEIDSRINIKHKQRSNGLSVSSVHTWNFDSSAYHAMTGLDLGTQYPHVPQENGHSLKYVSDMNVTRFDDGSYRIMVEAKAVRGTTSYRYFWTTNGGYEITNDGVVTDSFGERQPWRQAEADREIPHNEVHPLTDMDFADIYETLYHIHQYPEGNTIRETMKSIITEDSPDEAVTLFEYRQPNTTASPQNAD